MSSAATANIGAHQKAFRPATGRSGSVRIETLDVSPARLCSAVPSRAAVRCGPQVGGQTAPRGGAARYREWFLSMSRYCAAREMKIHLSHKRLSAAVSTTAILATLFGIAFVSGAQAQPSSDRLNSLLLDAGKKEYTRALQTISRDKNQAFIGPLIDLLRFVKTREELAALTKTLNGLIGTRIDIGNDPHEAYSMWYGAHPELKPPPGYIAWKGELLASRVDERFKVFLMPDSKTSIRPEEILWGGVKVAGIPSLDNPKTLPAEKVDYLADTDPVFGASVNGSHRAYPLKILDWHEMSNDVIGGVPVTLAYCTLCGSGILYDSTQKGNTFKFGSSGLLYRSNKLMFDDRNGSLWSQQTGEPVLGDLVGYGIKLNVLPLVVTSWGEWKKRHPDTTVVDIKTGHKRPYTAGAAYGEYFSNPGTMFPVWQQSKVLEKKERIFAIELRGFAKAYPLAELNRAGGIVNDTLGPETLTVIYRAAVGKVALPADWKAALGKAPTSTVEFANDLDFETIDRALSKDPKLAASASAEFLLALPTKVRLQVLHERTAGASKGRNAQFPESLRNEVAARALIGEVRAYARGRYEFRKGDAPDVLLDAEGQRWSLEEHALVGPNKEELPRLGGSLAYWFGWYAFRPKTEVFRVADAQ